MKQMTRYTARTLSMAALVLLFAGQALPSHANEPVAEAAKTTVEAGMDAAAASAKTVANEAAPAAETPAVVETKEPAVAAEPTLSADEKKSAIDAADEITRFKPEDMRGIAQPWQLGFQDHATPIKTAVVGLHNVVLVIITLITLFVLGLMIYIVLRFNKRANPKPATFTHYKLVEVIWTVIPILILVGIAIPSVRIHYKLYYNETALNSPDLTIKAVGHQWYWSYEYPEHGIAFDANMTPAKELPEGAPRLLETDNAIVVPVDKNVRIQLTSADVIHAWAIPAFGIKKGAVPGRLNETWFKAEKEGIYYGQCSVLCGKLHGFMPIKIIVVSQEKFDIWAKGAKLKYASTNSLQFAALNQ